MQGLMKRIARSIASLMPVLTSSVVAGPPMSTEDPGIVRQPVLGLGPGRCLQAEDQAA